MAIVGQTPRLSVSGNQVVSVATPIDVRGLPADVRTTLEAIAPAGVLEFCGEEWGPRGEGYRIEKSYLEPTPHHRSLLVAVDGAVLERSHTLPLPRVPQHVLATGLGKGSSIDSAEIVSGPVREEFWRLIVKDRSGRTFVVKVALDGTELETQRRSQSVVDG